MGKMQLFGLLVVCCVVFVHIGVEAKPNSQSVSEKVSVRDGTECSGLGGECKTNGLVCCGSLWCNGAADQHYCEDDHCSRGRTMWKQWKNLLPRFYLLLLTWNLYTINNNRGQSDIGRLYPEAAVVI